jgi:hypothetical protein
MAPLLMTSMTPLAKASVESPFFYMALEKLAPRAAKALALSQNAVPS